MVAIRGIVAIGLVAFAIHGAAAETPVERGGYLVTTIGSCGACHTPRDADGVAIPGAELIGGFEFDLPVGHVVGPNITPDPETGVGTWTEAQLVTALRSGKRPDGTTIGPPMPIPLYRQLSDNDIAAIAAYVHQLPPVRHAVARTQYKIPLPLSYGPPAAHVDEPPRADQVAYGRYLATFGHCVLCHTVVGAGGSLDLNRAYAGGRELPAVGIPGAVTVSRNITSDPNQGIGNWTDEEVRRAITAGIRPDGSRLNGIMPSAWFAKLTPADLDAIVAFLRTLPAIKTP